MTVVLVPPVRMERWVHNFVDRHGVTTLSVADCALRGDAEDGAHFVAHLPFATPYDGAADVAGLVAASKPPASWGVLLVRRGGFAVARFEGATLAEHKIGQRHVQGRTKAGGQSQQRFARRRANQARAAFEAAADHAARILRPGPVVVGGDRAAVDDVLGDARLARLEVCGPFLPVPDPRRKELDRAAQDAMAISVSVDNEPAA